MAKHTAAKKTTRVPQDTTSALLKPDDQTIYCPHAQAILTTAWPILHEYGHMIKFVLCQECFENRYQASPKGYGYNQKEPTDEHKLLQPITVVEQSHGTTQPSKWGGWRTAGPGPGARTRPGRPNGKESA